MRLSRRRFLVGSTVAIGFLSGCLADIEERTIGESVNIGGLVVTVDDFLTVPEVREAEVEEPETITPPPGAVYLLTHIMLKNDSDVQIELPTSSDTELMYSDEEAPLADVDYEDRVVYQGTEYIVYRFNYLDVKAVFPGRSFDGWLIHIVPEDFQPSKAVLEVDIETGEEDVIGEWTLG